MGEVQEGTCLPFNVPRMLQLCRDFSLPVLRKGRHRTHILEHEVWRGARVEPSNLVRDVEGGLPNSLVSPPYRASACHFKGCGHHACNVFTRPSVGGSEPSHWRNGNDTGTEYRDRNEFRQVIREHYPAGDPKTSCNDGIGDKQPADGSMRERTLKGADQLAWVNVTTNNEIWKRTHVSEADWLHTGSALRDLRPRSR